MTPEALWEEAADRLQEVWRQDRSREQRIYVRLQEAFQRAEIHGSDLAPEMGYAFHPVGLGKLEGVLSHYFRAEAALVRSQMVSGTHALTMALEALVPDGGLVLVATGAPYDSLWPVLGLAGSHPGSLPAQHGVRVQVVDLTAPRALADAAERYRPDVVLVQRSRGYADDPSRSVAECDQICRHFWASGVVTIVDNCYGEFVEEDEPASGAHGIVVGSLIKNPGGTLAPSGAYVVGAERLVQRVGERLFGAALGRAPGPTPGGIRPYVQGLHLAPHLVCEAIAVSRQAAYLFGRMGYDVDPMAESIRTDLVLRIRTGGEAKLLAAMRALQAQMPIDAHLVPEPAAWPGYRNAVVMAGAVFVPGGTLELSADAPMRPPFDLFLQGGLSPAQARVPLLAMANAIGAA